MRFGTYLAIGVLVVLLFVASGAFFTVSQVEDALLLNFGEPVGLITDPGLHTKIPLVQSVVYVDNRIIDLETLPQEVLASDNQRLLVDAFMRYHIIDPLKFYQAVGTVERANNQLGSVLNSALRRVLGEATQDDIVRDKRAELMVRIRDLVNGEGARLGVAVNDVRIRRVDLPQQISEKVFGRMQTERAREAAEFRAQGSQQAQTITAKADRDVVVIRADAQRQADQLRGTGDAERNRIFAEAYGKDPSFFAFYRSMQAYVTAFKPDRTRLVLAPDSEFFRFFSSPRPSGTPLASGTPLSGAAAPSGETSPDVGSGANAAQGASAAPAPSAPPAAGAAPAGGGAPAPTP